MNIGCYDKIGGCLTSRMSEKQNDDHGVTDREYLGANNNKYMLKETL